MRKPILTIFYQLDPCNTTIGGIQTLIRSFIKYAPDDFKLRLVGITSNPGIKLNRWYEITVDGTELSFMPLLYIKDDNVRSLVPTTLKYTLALLGHRFKSDFMHFHRLEPTVASIFWSSHKTLFIHNDIHQQMVSKEAKDAILWRYFPQAYFVIERLLVNQFEQILSCSSDSVDLYKKHYPDVSSKVDFVRNSVDDDVFYSISVSERNASRLRLAQEMSLPRETRFILFAGRLHPQKDPLLLVRSISVLNDPSIHLLVAGEGELASSMKDQINQLGLSKQVTMLGGVSKTELAQLHHSSSLCILTSLYEGLPLVVLEALSCGTPIVTTDCGETPKILNSGGGVICQERSPSEIAGAIRMVLSHPENFSPEICSQVAKPYKASQVIRDIYANMLEQWRT